MVMLAWSVLGAVVLLSGWFVTESPGTVFVLFLAFVFATWVAALVFSARARNQEDFLVASTDEVVLRAVASLFGPLWKQVDGPGQLNYKARGMGLGVRSFGVQPTMSIDAEQFPEGVQVSVWTSHWINQGGMVIGVDRIMAHRWRIRRALAALPVSGDASTPV
ncbi:hypothetical protein SAMN05444374_1092 [Rhodococcoides kroppenstedtii]|uniref:Uncharacterized protein n=1 Tax=Rhodococcoides kroppenstedtii TaxID=293050 RepID=A0A1I0TRI7_9NOCA|nr:hypothetical protein [Rhodococcus kroppenstedtii]SFA54320.1 hypothetical protein SAMN05444374_1092 [Rhodococcus kroppenstedtii]